MKRLISLLLVLLSVPLYAQQWQLVWSDEFNGSGLDLSKWSYQIGTGYQGWGNNELQYYTNRPVNVDVFDGHLWIVAHRENFGGMQYTSARIRTKNKGDWRFGRIEMRAKLHFANQSQQHQYQGAFFTLQQGTFNDNFHLFWIEWQQNEIKWYVDSTLYFTRVPAHLGGANWPFNERFHIILNVAVGGNWPGSPDSTTVFPQAMVVDYVRVYQRSPLSAQNTPEKPTHFTLEQNYPNPFNPTTTLTYQLAKTSDVRLEVFDVLGKKIAMLVNAKQEAGSYTVNFNAAQYNLSSGVYFYKLTAGTFSQTRKMILAK